MLSIKLAAALQYGRQRDTNIMFLNCSYMNEIMAPSESKLSGGKIVPHSNQWKVTDLEALIREEYEIETSIERKESRN